MGLLFRLLFSCCTEAWSAHEAKQVSDRATEALATSLRWMSSRLRSRSWWRLRHLGDVYTSIYQGEDQAKSWSLNPTLGVSL